MTKKMKYHKLFKGLKSAVIFSCLFTLLSCRQQDQKKLSENNNFKCFCNSQTDSLYFSNNVPFDGGGNGGLNGIINQGVADCFAWQQFIALNWPQDPTHQFGTPGNTSAVQWETYIPKNILFNDEGTAPPNWGSWDALEAIKSHKDYKALKGYANKLLTFSSKFGEDDADAFSFSEAAPNGPNWLGAQNGTNVWYEVLLNKDYYNYVKSKGFYNAKTQHDSVQHGQFINFPVGQTSSYPVGAIELKIAWMEIDESADPNKWNRYKISNAIVRDPKTQQLRAVKVALVGMHILHKTASQPTWVWSTFEHVDNVATDTSFTGNNHPYGFNFFNKNCTTNCDANTPPTKYLKDTTPYPIQVTRVNAFKSTASNTSINSNVQTFIQNKFPNSVWQYYELVDVIWGQNAPTASPTDTLAAPNNIQFGQTSDYATVANTTMETYVQQTKTCLNCHRFSTIAPYSPNPTYNKLFGDFSFAIRAAKYKQEEKKDIQKLKNYIQKNKK